MTLTPDVESFFKTAGFDLRPVKLHEGGLRHMLVWNGITVGRIEPNGALKLYGVRAG